MIRRPPDSSRKAAIYYILIGLTALVAAYIDLVAVFSIWIGFHSAHRMGFWLPVVAGGSLFLLVLWIFLGISRYLVNAAGEEDLINL
jgi:hypothetical protein